MNNTYTENYTSITHAQEKPRLRDSAKPEMIYQLVKTPAVTLNGSGKFRSVYSILALEKCGENVKSNFIYDISRTGKKAHEIIENVRTANPTLPAEEFIADIL